MPKHSAKKYCKLQRAGFELCNLRCLPVCASRYGHKACEGFLTTTVDIGVLTIRPPLLNTSCRGRDFIYNFSSKALRSMTRRCRRKKSCRAVKSSQDYHGNLCIVYASIGVHSIIIVGHVPDEIGCLHTQSLEMIDACNETQTTL